MSRTGSSSRKLPARTYSTSWHSAGEALSTDTARGRLLSAADSDDFRALAAASGPDGEAPFLRLRKWRRRSLLPDLGTGRKTSRRPGRSGRVGILRKSARAWLPALSRITQYRTRRRSPGTPEYPRAAVAERADVENRALQRMGVLQKHYLSTSCKLDNRALISSGNSGSTASFGFVSRIFCFPRFTLNTLRSTRPASTARRNLGYLSFRRLPDS
jgi:hypothetical protein